MQVLLVDGGAGRDAIVAELRDAGMQVVVAGSLLAARRALSRDPVDLVLLERELPDGDSLSLVRELRARDDGRPMLGLTGRDAPVERVAGLRAGLDDYIGRPHHPEELLARIEAVARRTRLGSELRVGPLHIETDRHRVECRGEAVELTAREFELLVALARSSPTVRSRAELLDEVWGVTQDPGSNLVDVYVRYLRTKLGRGLIRTVRGVGYALDPTERAARSA